MVWGKAGSETLISSADTITITGITPSKFNTILNHNIKVTGSLNLYLRVGNGSIDSASSYAESYNVNGGSSDTPSGGSGTSKFGNGSEGTPDDNFTVGYAFNLSGEEKLFMLWAMHSGGVGASENPKRREVVGKWVTTSGQFDQISAVNTGAAGDYDIGSNITLLGSDLTPIPPTVQDGAVFEETDTNKHYLLDDGTWTEI